MSCSNQPSRNDHTGWPDLPTALLVGGITLLGLGVRLYALGRKSIWLDEAFSIWLAQQPVGEMWRWLVQIDQHPPLYYTLLHYWILWGGNGQGWIRLFSALCSGLAIPFFYGACRAFGPRSVALLASLLLALSPFHLHYAQEARMYALLTLTAAMALYWLTLILSEHCCTRTRWPWLGLGLAQVAVMLTHNTATVFFPLALNSLIGGALLWQWWTGTPSSLPALTRTGFVRRWAGTQALVLLGWLPWSVPFVRQSIQVDRDFWIAPPTLASLYEALHTFTFAFLPGWSPMMLVLNLGCWVLAMVGVWSLRRTPARAALLVVLWLLPLLGELVVSLRRPIFSDRTLIWTTLPYYLLLTLGLCQVGQLLAGRTGMLVRARWLTAGIAAVILSLNSWGIANYYHYFVKEEWDQAAAYVAQHSAPGDLILFHATWIQLPFDYYFRQLGPPAELRGVPVDLFARGVLEPKMTAADRPRLRQLLAGHRHVWLIYSHDWYTDPQALIVQELQQHLLLREERSFLGLRVMHFQQPP